jgi:hypothetical protein
MRLFNEIRLFELQGEKWNLNSQKTQASYMISNHNSCHPEEHDEKYSLYYIRGKCRHSFFNFFIPPITSSFLITNTLCNTVLKHF